MPKSTRVTVVDLPQDDSWFRDTGPVVSWGPWHGKHVASHLQTWKWAA
jgi:agmatine/peptidylarginine deiminase